MRRLRRRAGIRLPPVGFWSYTRDDDRLSGSQLSKLRSLLLAELRAQYGRGDVRLFQDVSTIPPGADWEQVTEDAVKESTFFIPILTPFYMQSEWCAHEARMFAARERAVFDTHPDLPRDRRRIFPLLWIDVKDAEPFDEAALAPVVAAQWSDFSALRHCDLARDPEARVKIADFAKSIVEVLHLRVKPPGPFARLIAMLRSRKYWLVAGGVVAILVAGLIMMRVFNVGEPERRNANPAAGDTPAPASSGNVQTAPAPAAAPDIGWLFHSWCVNGNRANVQTIRGDRTRISIAFGGAPQIETVQEIGEGFVRTDIARYTRRGNVLVIYEQGLDPQTLERCG